MLQSTQLEQEALHSRAVYKGALPSGYSGHIPGNANRVGRTASIENVCEDDVFAILSDATNASSAAVYTTITMIVMIVIIIVSLGRGDHDVCWEAGVAACQR